MDVGDGGMVSRRACTARGRVGECVSSRRHGRSSRRSPHPTFSFFAFGEAGDPGRGGGDGRTGSDAAKNGDAMEHANSAGRELDSRQAPGEVGTNAAVPDLGNTARRSSRAQPLASVRRRLQNLHASRRASPRACGDSPFVHIVPQPCFSVTRCNDTDPASRATPIQGSRAPSRRV